MNGLLGGSEHMRLLWDIDSVISGVCVLWTVHGGKLRVSWQDYGYRTREEEETERGR